MKFSSYLATSPFGQRFFFRRLSLSVRQISWDDISSDATVLAPRFIVKYFKTVYLPLDKDIVREMWVKGDLKDQLGIGHRKPKKSRKGGSLKNLEATPMFQHNHSNSDVSNSGDTYEPTVAPILSRSPAPNYTDTPPITQASTPPAPESHLRANPNNRGGLSPSPSERIPSYYSASDLPAPSPMPDPIYKYPTGEITPTPPSPRTSVVSKASPRTGHAPLPSTSSQLAQIPHNLMQLPEARSHNHPEVFEMHVRAPSDDQGMTYSPAFERSGSSASYATAVDSYHTADDGHPIRQEGRRSPHAPPGHGWSSEDSHTTAVASRSISPYWEGPRAI